MIVDVLESADFDAGFSTTSSFGGLTSTSKMSDLDDINRTLYDLAAQDLLDVWDTPMESEDGSSSTTSSSDTSATSWSLNSYLNSCPSAATTAVNSAAANNSLLPQSDSLILKDRLLTDPMLFGGIGGDDQLPLVAVKHEHSYSINNNNNNNGGATVAKNNEAGSDGDSVPASPVSLQDDMETECYPAIPMHSASNQQNQQHQLNISSSNQLSLLKQHHNKQLIPQQAAKKLSSIAKIGLGGETITIKNEPLEADTVNVVDDDVTNDVTGDQSSAGVDTLKVKLSRKRNSLSQLQHNNNILATTVNGNAVFVTRPSNDQPTLQFARPKHPQSLLKQKQPLAPALPAGHTLVTSGHSLVTNGANLVTNGATHTILVTPSSSNISNISPGGNSILASTAHLGTPVTVSNAANGHVIVTSFSPAGPTFLAKPQPDVGAGKLLFSRLSSPAATSCGLSGTTTLTLTSPIKQEVTWSANPTTPTFFTGATNTSYDSTYRSALTSDLISNQPADSNGILILTDEEKKTLISEGYPIPTKLPLSKSEEKSLKKIRRKIKNKISAQESRRKKKEFVDTLERQVEVASTELGEYKRKCESLEKENATLLSQLKSLRAMVVSSSKQELLQQQQNKDGTDQLENIACTIKTEPMDGTVSGTIDGLGLD